MRKTNRVCLHVMSALAIFAASACGADDTSGSSLPDADVEGGAARDGGSTQEDQDGSNAPDGAASANPDATLGDADGGAPDALSADGAARDATVPGADDAGSPEADAGTEGGAPEAQDASADGSTTGDGAGDGGAADVTAGDAARDGSTANDAEAGLVAYAYVGTYLGGIWPYSIATSTGAATLIGDAAVDRGAAINSLAVYPNGTLLYAVDGAGAGAIRGYRVGTGGALSSLSGFPMSIGTAPIAITIDGGGVFAYVSASDGIHVYEIIAASGALQEVGGSPFARSAAPYFMAVDPFGRFLYGAAAGGIHIYSIGVTGTLAETQESPVGGDSLVIGALVFHPSGRFLYASGAGGSGLNGWSVGATTGDLTPLAGSPFSVDVTSDIFATDLAIDRTGESAFATNNSNGHLTAFDVDASTGFLSRRLVLDSGGAAYSVAVDPGGRFVFVGIDDANLFGIDLLGPASGALTPAEGSPFAGTGLQPQTVIVDAP